MSPSATAGYALSFHAPVLFESMDHRSVLEDPANRDWLLALDQMKSSHVEDVARRYHLALSHLRTQGSRPKLGYEIEVVAQGRQRALEGMLEILEQRKSKKSGDLEAKAPSVLYDALPQSLDETTLPEALGDFSKAPPSLSEILAGPGRPPCDGRCLLRAFTIAPLLGVDDDPTSVFHLLRSNPTFARNCGFEPPAAKKEPWELCSRALPGLSTCEEFAEVMSRYGLWSLVKLGQIRANLRAGIIEIEDTISADTSHIEAHSHCANVAAPQAQPDSNGKTKHRKVPRVRKKCSCGQEEWETCEHPWEPTDQGAAVVVKGPTRIYWAHKTSVLSFGESEIPIDVRVCQYAAEGDGKTLLPHLELLKRDLPEVATSLRFVLADDAYRHNGDLVASLLDGVRLIVPVHGKRIRDAVAAGFQGISHFTPNGTPICEEGHRFELLGRDLESERYIWSAPDDGDHKSVCEACPLANTCLSSGRRRHIRVDREDLPQINWDHPQHFAREKKRYAKRTGVERAIKRLKVDFRAEHLSQRGLHRVQAHLDRKLFALHLLLAATDSS